MEARLDYNPIGCIAKHICSQMGFFWFLLIFGTPGTIFHDSGGPGVGLQIQWIFMPALGHSQIPRPARWRVNVLVSTPNHHLPGS